MSSITVLVFTILLFPATLLTGLTFADDKKQAQDAVDRIKKEFENHTKPKKDSMLELIRKQEKYLQKLGNLEGMRTAMREVGQFQNRGTLPTCVSTINYRKSITLDYEAACNRFEEESRKWTKAGKIELADMVSDELRDFDTEFKREFPNTLYIRTEWVHTTGRFEKVNGAEWVEHRSGHGATPFVEAQRTPQFVKLTNNGGTIYLYDDCCHYQKAGAKKKGLAYWGHWK